ncbi:GL14885 [Drosophila persimilis]|uniref:Odorant receptor n=1 Tax=Drosophila persimilis TaxID=7234 RepID=B4H0C6_DROPE|nr:odorant receptor 9a [Drosophila persimilis]EDW29721.1 GL14885 [Drosophila persimilis]
MAKTNETNSLRVQILVYRLMGIDLWSPTAVNDRHLVTFVTMGPLFAFMLPMFLSARENITEVSLLSDTLGSTFASMLTLVKYLLFVYYRKEFVGMIYRIRSILEKEINVWPEAKEIVDAENRSDQMLSLTYTRCFCMAGVFAAIKPFVTMSLALLRDGGDGSKLHLELPHMGVYPYDYQVMWFFVPTYLWNVMASYSAVTMALCVDTLLFFFTYNVCAIFKIARQRLVHLPAMGEADPRGELEAVVQVLLLHQKGLWIADFIADHYRPLIFLQFFLSALQICFIGFQVADLFPKPQSLYFIAFVGSLLIALFIYSRCGENIKEASLDFGDGIYESNWMEFAPSTKRVLLIASMRAQRPCQMKGYFFEASMATFSTIVRSAMSYIMMLRSFNV